MYAVILDNVSLAKRIIKEIEGISNKRKRNLLLESTVPKTGLSEFSIIGKTNTLETAMAIGSPDMVTLLLDSGVGVCRFVSVVQRFYS